jgi:hypothetical protein
MTRQYCLLLPKITEETRQIEVMNEWKEAYFGFGFLPSSSLFCCSSFFFVVYDSRLLLLLSLEQENSFRDKKISESFALLVSRICSFLFHDKMDNNICLFIWWKGSSSELGRLFVVRERDTSWDEKERGKKVEEKRNSRLRRKESGVKCAEQNTDSSCILRSWCQTGMWCWRDTPTLTRDCLFSQKVFMFQMIVSDDERQRRWVSPEKRRQPKGRHESSIDSESDMSSLLFLILGREFLRLLSPSWPWSRGQTERETSCHGSFCFSGLSIAVRETEHRHRNIQRTSRNFFPLLSSVCQDYSTLLSFFRSYSPSFPFIWLIHYWLNELDTRGPSWKESGSG